MCPLFVRVLHQNKAVGLNMPYLSILHGAVYIGLSPLFEPLFGLDREAKGYVLCAVEDLKQMIADQAAKFALGPGF
jgi:hypothetical protein